MDSLVGNRYGKLLVIKYGGKDSRRNRLWDCVCDCGVTTIVKSSYLNSKGIKSCGCLHGTKEIPGTKYGKLTIIKRHPVNNMNRHIMWVCACDCGKERITSGTYLRKGHIKSCGCLNNLPKGEANFNGALMRMKYNAIRRGYKWELTKKAAKNLFELPCVYCGREPSNKAKKDGCNGSYLYSGIDRIDNNKGYVEGNVVSCCIDCNKAKGKKTTSEFLRWVVGIIRHNEWENIGHNEYIFKKKLESWPLSLEEKTNENEED